MNYDKLVSVVMPVHNGEKFLHEAIESVLNQTYANFEFLIIENCSVDRSVEIIKSCKDPRIRLIIEKDCGQVQAYNRGFKEAKGEFIFIHDQDDISHPERFEKQLGCMIERKVDICGSYINLIDEKGVMIDTVEMPIKHLNIIDELLYKNSVIFNSATCLKRKVFKSTGYFAPEYFPSADYDFYLKGIVEFKYGNVPEFLYSWRQHFEQISNKYINEVFEKTISISLKNKERFPQRMKNTYTGLVYYYNDKLIKSYKYFLKAFCIDKKTKKLFRYLIILFVFGFPLKIFRKFNLLNSNIFITSKHIFNKIF